MASIEEKILVIGPAWIGDMVMAQSLFQHLKRRYPRVQIDVVAPAWTEPLLARMPEVNAWFTLPIGHGRLELRERWRLGRRLRSRGYGRAIVLPNSFKSAIVPFVAGVRRRTGFLGEWRLGLLNDIRALNRARLPRRVDRYLALGLEPGEAMPDPLPRPRLSASRAAGEAALTRLGQCLPQVPVLGLCPGAEHGAAKRWPAEYFAELAKAKLEDGWEVWLFGSAKDTDITGQIQQRTGGRCLDLGGRTTLADCIDLLGLTSAVVSNDSGLMHIAASLERTLVALYGSTAPDYNPPLSPRAQVLYLALPCSPCYQRECPLGHLNCLRHIEPARVVAALSAPAS